MYKLYTKATLVAACATFAFAQTPQASQSADQTNPAPQGSTLNSPPTGSAPTSSRPIGSTPSSTAPTPSTQIAPAQSTTTPNSAIQNSATQNSPTPSSAPQSSAALGATAPAGQSYRGVLMDASCSVIQNRAVNLSNTGSQLSADATRVREPIATPAAPTQTTSIAGNSTNEGGVAATRNTTADSTGANQSQQGQAAAQAGVPSPTLQAYDGSGTRARTADAARVAGTGGDWTSVREKYKDCKVTSSTSSFAIMANGQLYMIDDTAGAVRQRMSSANAAASTGTDFQTVSVMGTPQGDRISVTSVR